MNKLNIKSNDYERNDELSKIWSTLQDIFTDYRGLKSRDIKKLNSINFYVDMKGNHTRIIMPVGVMIISHSPSDKNAGRQILRQIRRMYSKEN